MGPGFRLFLSKIVSSNASSYTIKQHIIYSEQDVFPVLATCDYDVDAC